MSEMTEQDKISISMDARSAERRKLLQDLQWARDFINRGSAANGSQGQASAVSNDSGHEHIEDLNAVSATSDQSERGALNDAFRGSLEPECQPHNSLQKRFWSKVHKGLQSECWEWKGARSSLGYGLFFMNGKCRIASRVSWEMIHGDISDGLLCLHKCDNPPCCNPVHLFLGTNADNMADKVSKGRQSRRPGTMVSVLSTPQIRIIKRSLLLGVQQKFLSRLFGISPSSMFKIAHERMWKSITVLSGASPKASLQAINRTLN